jgi:hypothetical protein
MIDMAERSSWLLAAVGLTRAESVLTGGMARQESHNNTDFTEKEISHGASRKCLFVLREAP